MSLLRQAWKHAEAARVALAKAKRYATAGDLLESFLIQATSETEKSKAAMERAGALIASLKAQVNRQL